MTNRKKMILNLQEIIRFVGSDLLNLYGDTKDVFIDNLADVGNINETTLDWINPSKTNKQEIAEQSKAKVILVDSDIKYTSFLEAQNKVLIVVDNPKLALAKIGNQFFIEKLKPFIHPTAIVDKEAIIGDKVYIGPYSIIGKSKIGDRCIINAHVHIYDNVVIGSNSNVKSGAVLGGEGFGYERDKNGNLFSFPQIGNLIIGDNVEIGSNTTIDRGALSDTIIGDYTKINNLCHIAHNNKIGSNVVITGCVNISGSNIIEDNVWIAPNTSILGWLSIGKGAKIGMGSVVTKNIPANEVWFGNPARKHKKR